MVGGNPACLQAKWWPCFILNFRGVFAIGHLTFWNLMFCGCTLQQAPRYKFPTCLHDIFTLMILSSVVIAQLVSKQRKPLGNKSANDLKNKWQTMIDLRGWLNRILVRPMSNSATSNEKPFSELHGEVDSIPTVYNCILVPAPIMDCRLCLSALRTSEVNILTVLEFLGVRNHKICSWDPGLRIRIRMDPH